MSEADRRFHEQWLGMAQPMEGLVVSLPVLVDAQCAEKHPREVHLAFLDCLEGDVESGLHVSELARILEAVMGFEDGHFDVGDALPRELSLYVIEGKQTLRPTRALRARTPRPESMSAAESTPAAVAGRPYAMLIWEVPTEVIKLDKPELVTGAWEYPAQAKFERLLRECRVPIGLLSNGHEVRLVYAPHGESSGWISFRVNDMASVSGRPLFDAFVMLLSRERWFGVAEAQQLPAILADSRRRNADVTVSLSGQVFEALEVLLAGFSAADERDHTGALRAALERQDDHLYAGLLSVLLRLVFLLYCEDRGLLPTDHPLFAENYSLLGLYDSLQADHGAFPDTMHRRFGAYPRLVSLFRAVFLGVSHRDLTIPARRGHLFDPNVYPFLEGGFPDSAAAINQPEARAEVTLPSVDDRTVYTVLDKLLFLDGQRLSYKALDVEQIGSVYEALMGFAIARIETGAVRIKLGSKKGSARVWVEAESLLAQPANQRERWLQDELGFDKNVASKIVAATTDSKSAIATLTALEPLSGRVPERAQAGVLVVQPGPERRRTSSHYTPRSLTEPIVARTLEPLIKAMGENPSSDALLSLVICDPAVGSGAFLVAACRYLADHVVAAWTREGRIELVASTHDVVNHARRLVAQRCLYGVDKNRYAVQLARLSLWLVTMARNEPFTFVDHAIRHGDSLVGLNFDQIRGFHWKPKAQVELSSKLLSDALAEAIEIRKLILDMADEGTYAAQREKERLLLDAEDALNHVRLIADLVIGAFFSQKTDKDREKERNRRLDLVTSWLSAEHDGDEARANEIHDVLRGLQDDLLATQVPFHWMAEFPEVFYLERPDPLDGGKVNGAAMVEAFVGNPPFMGGSHVSGEFGVSYRDWLKTSHENADGRGDLCAHFFWRAYTLLGINGTAGFVATNSIAQGDTRETGLMAVVSDGGQIYDATNTVEWPGLASVVVSVVHFSTGASTFYTEPILLDGVIARSIDSFLRAGSERKESTILKANESICYQGNKLNGSGFVLSPKEREDLVLHAPANLQVIFPYLGGEEINTSPAQTFHRYVINFGKMTLEQAAYWPELLARVKELVKPARDAVQRDTGTGGHGKKYWWQFIDRCDLLWVALSSCSRCLVVAGVSKHLVFAWQPKNRVLSHALFVFAADASTFFTCLQTRFHEYWVRLLSSSMKSDLRYAPTDCFETFPFPQADPRTVIPALETIGETLYETRSKFMVDTDQGLTKTYNAIKDPNNTDPKILELRQLHEEMDRAVLQAYAEGDPDGNWLAVEVPPYCPKNDEEKAAVKRFEDEVIDRLFALNAKRAEEERKAMPVAKPAKKQKVPVEATKPVEVPALPDNVIPLHGPRPRRPKPQPQEEMRPAAQVAQLTLLGEVERTAAFTFGPEERLLVKLRKVFPGEEISAIAKRLKMTVKALEGFHEFLHLLPDSARTAFEHRVEQAAGLAAGALAGLAAVIPEVAARHRAARELKKGPLPATFLELLGWLKLSAKEKAEWGRFAENLT